MSVGTDPSSGPVALADDRRGLRLSRSFGAAKGVEDWLINRQHATYGLAASRIALGCAVLGLLLSNAADRQRVWGSAAVWLQRDSSTNMYPLTGFVGDLPGWGFDLFFLATTLLSVAFVVGWRTRLVTPALMLSSTAVFEQAPMLGQAGDNLIRVALIMMCLLNTSEHWSLDRRRLEARRARGKRTLVPEWLLNVVHNSALIALLSNVAFIYAAAGMYKLQGPLWQNGTALYFPLQLPDFRPFPLVNDVLTHFGLTIGLMTYVTVVVQLFFVPMLLHPVTRRIAIALVMMLHLGIALLMALPWFSMAMVSVDLILVSSGTYLALESRVEPILRRCVSRIREGASSGAAS